MRVCLCFCMSVEAQRSTNFRKKHSSLLPLSTCSQSPQGKPASPGIRASAPHPEPSGTPETGKAGCSNWLEGERGLEFGTREPVVPSLALLPTGCGTLAPAQTPKTTLPTACCEETLVQQPAWEPGRAQRLPTHSASSILPPALQAAQPARAAEAPWSRWNQGPSLLCVRTLPSPHRRALVAALSGPGESRGQPGSQLRAPGRPPAGREQTSRLSLQPVVTGGWAIPSLPLTPAAPACRPGPGSQPFPGMSWGLTACLSSGSLETTSAWESSAPSSGLLPY